MCDLKCDFFTTPRAECQRDPCLAFGNSCRGYATNVNSTTFAAQSSPKCSDWCCQANEPKMTTTIVACAVGFFVLLGITFYAFRRYAAWKKLRDDDVAEREYNPCHRRNQQMAVYHDGGHVSSPGAGGGQRKSTVSANGAGRLEACKAFFNYCRSGKSGGGGGGCRAMIPPPTETKPPEGQECVVASICPSDTPAATAEDFRHVSETNV